MNKTVVKAFAALAVAAMVSANMDHERTIVLPPNDEIVQYEEAFIRGPGYIDLSGFRFKVYGESVIDMIAEGDDEYYEEYYDEDDYDEDSEQSDIDYDENGEEDQFNEKVETEYSDEYVEETIAENDNAELSDYDEGLGESDEYSANMEQDYNDEYSNQAAAKEDITELDNTYNDGLGDSSEDFEDVYGNDSIDTNYSEYEGEQDYEYDEEQEEEYEEELYEEYEEEVEEYEDELGGDYSDEYGDEYGDGYGDEYGDGYGEEYDDEGGNRRKRRRIKKNGKLRNLEEEKNKNNSEDSQFLDIVMFPLPKHCGRKDSCDWVNLGVGKKTKDGETYWCCNQAMINEGLCDETTSGGIGRIMLDEGLFQGHHISIPVPREGEMDETPLTTENGRFMESESGMYVVLYANCNALDGREVAIQGRTMWKSTHGYLPGELYGFMNFYWMVTLIYAILCGWFCYLMNKYKDQRIQIEKWILLAIGTGLIEMIFRDLQYLTWNSSGVRNEHMVLIAILVGVFKEGFSRCILVMVSMGWGIAVSSLEFFTMAKIVGLGAAYSAVAGLLEVTIIYTSESVQTLSYDQEKKLINEAMVLSYIKGFLNLGFIVWIYFSLEKTSTYLHDLKQSRKLSRMQYLRIIFLCSVIFTLLWSVFAMVDRHSGESSLIGEEHAWLKDAASEMNYVFVLVCIAILWRPNAFAQDYASVMELATEDGDKNLPDVRDFSEEESL